MSKYIICQSFKKIHCAIFSIAHLNSKTVIDTKQLKYRKTCLNQTSLGPTFVLGIERCLVYTGQVIKIFLHWDLISSLVYRGFRFNQGSVQTDLNVYEQLLKDDNVTLLCID